MATHVALVSAEPVVELVRYLQAAGFSVIEFRVARDLPRQGTLVWLVDQDIEDTMILGTVDAWLGESSRLRAVIVSDRPARLDSATRRGRNRVVHLPAPVFGWQLIDALREGVGRV